MALKDPEKRREYNRRYYQTVDKKKQQQRIKARTRRLAADYQAWKSTKSCLHCGESDPVCLEFHHVDPRTKDVDPGNMVTNKGWTLARIVGHLEANCIPLCSNCHKKVHRDLKQLERKLNESTARSAEREPGR